MGDKKLHLLCTKITDEMLKDMDKTFAKIRRATGKHYSHSKVMRCYIYIIQSDQQLKEFFRLRAIEILKNQM